MKYTQPSHQVLCHTLYLNRRGVFLCPRNNVGKVGSYSDIPRCLVGDGLTMVRECKDGGFHSYPETHDTTPITRTPIARRHDIDTFCVMCVYKWLYQRNAMVLSFLNFTHFHSHKSAIAYSLLYPEPPPHKVGQNIKTINYCIS